MLPPLVAIPVEAMNWLGLSGKWQRNRGELLLQIRETPLFVQEKMNKRSIVGKVVEVRFQTYRQPHRVGGLIGVSGLGLPPGEMPERLRAGWHCCGNFYQPLGSVGGWDLCFSRLFWREELLGSWE